MLRVSFLHEPLCLGVCIRRVCKLLFMCYLSLNAGFPLWFDHGGVSGSSSDEALSADDFFSNARPRWPLVPTLTHDAECYATWDLLTRPAGMSLRRLCAVFTRRHGRPSRFWEPSLRSSPYLVFYRARVGESGPPVYAGQPPPAGCLLSVWRVRRLWPEEFPPEEGTASARLAAAQQSIAAFPDRAAQAKHLAPQVHIGSADIPVLPVSESPPPFSNRARERRSDAETLLSAFPVCNVPPSLPHEDPLPPDQPNLQASNISEVLTHNAVAKLRSFSRQWRRVWSLLQRGEVHAARRARPPALVLKHRSACQPLFRGVTVDFTVFPFRSLQPSRWPDRPPSTSLHIRAVRQDFRDYPDIPNKWLRGAISHGNPRGAACEEVTHLDGPHGSAFQHFAEWSRQIQKELDAGWGRLGHPSAFGLTSFPQRCIPTSMVERHGQWRLCHDMSWPHDGAVDGVTSPNAAEADVRKVTFSRLLFHCLAAAIFMVSGAPVRQAKCDLSKAYKQNGQQHFTTWARSYLTPQGCATLDRICFGQIDGPEAFSGQTDVHCFIIQRELSYAEACYPPVHPGVLAWQASRRSAAQACGADASLWCRLFFVMAMIDDFSLVAFDDLLFRVDGSAVRLPSGRQRSRAFLYFSILKSVVRRWGYVLDADKKVGPNLCMLLLGAIVDLIRETLSLEPAKRVRYLQRLRDSLAADGVVVSHLLRLAYRLLVVCATYPLAHQWLHSFFRAVRGVSSSSVFLRWDSIPNVRTDAERFVGLLAGDVVLEVPLASRLSFPLEGAPHLIVKYDDASGLPLAWLDEDHRAGFGSWCVRSGCLFVIHGVWETHEAALPSSAFELLIEFMSTAVYASAFDGVTHVLGFTDNTGTEWAARRETPHSALLQRIIAHRSEVFQSLGVFTRSARVSTSDNRWADALSRQRFGSVRAEAEALGLRVVELVVPPLFRDTSWLFA